MPRLSPEEMQAKNDARAREEAAVMDNLPTSYTLKALAYRADKLNPPLKDSGIDAVVALPLATFGEDKWQTALFRVRGAASPRPAHAC